MKQAEIIVPFGTGLAPELLADDSENDGMHGDDDLALTDLEITGRYPVPDLEDGMKLVAAAEALGFACTYINDHPGDDDSFIYVIISLRARIL